MNAEQYLIDTSPLLGGVRKLYRFPNNYGASVVKHPFSYGSKDNLWELAVVKFDKNEFSLNYDTPITDDVIGFLTYEKVTDILNKISELPNTPLENILGRLCKYLFNSVTRV